MELATLCQGESGEPDARIEAAIRAGDVEALHELLDATSLSPLELLVTVCTEGAPQSQVRMAELLLGRGADPNVVLGVRGCAPVHVAAQRGLPGVLQAMLSHGARPGQLTSSGETALHCAVRAVKDNCAVRAVKDDQIDVSENRALECVKILVSGEKLDVDVRDDIGGFTAIHFAAIHHLWNIVEFLVQEKIQAHCDITINGQTARNIINKYRPDLIENYAYKDEPEPDFKTKLFTLLTAKKQTEFLQHIENNDNTASIINATNGKHTLLQAAVCSGLVEATQKLIDMGVDVNMTSGEERSPTILATHLGDDKVLKALLNTTRTDLSAVDNQDHKFTALHVAVITTRSNTRCLELLLEHAQSHKLDINAQDYRQYTALHYAAKKNQIENVELLIKHNANLFLLNDQKVPAFFYVDPRIVTDYLDENISSEGSSASDVQYALLLDYNFLATSEPAVEDNTGGPTNSVTYVAVPLAESASPAPEMDPLVLLASSPNHRPLLNHPLIRSFLHLKWHRIYWFFYINFIMYMAFTASLSIHIYYLVTSDAVTGSNATLADESPMDKTKSHEGLFWWLTLILLLWLLFREIVQLSMSFWRYVCHLENWLEVALMFLAATLLLVPTAHYERHSMSAVAILLAYTELVLLIGRHPSLATYITMFLRVSCSFVYFLLWYSLLIVAFGFSFYIIFQHCESQEACKDNFFVELGSSLFKTIIMLTGEFESTDLEFDSISVTSHIIFLLFLFFIAIVLLNLLNGLAVSDTQSIREEAEILCCVAQVKLYAQMESTLLGENNNEKYNCIRSCVGNIGLLKRFRIWLGSKILLLSGLLPDKKLRVYVNDWNRMDPDVRSSCRRGCANVMDGGLCCLQDTCMRKSCRWCLVFNTIVSDARDVLLQRGHLNDTQQILARLDKLEKSLKAIADAVHAKI